MILNSERKRIISAQWRYLMFPLALLMVIGGLLVPAQPVESAVAPATNNFPALVQTDEEQNLLDLFKRFSEAVARGDYSLAKQIGLGDVFHTDGDRTFIVLKGTKIDNVQVIQFEVKNIKISVGGEAARVSYLANMRLKQSAGDQPFDLTGSFIARFAKRDGEWHAVYSEKGPPPPPPPPKN